MSRRTLRVLHSLPPLQFAPFFVAAGRKLFADAGVDVETIFDRNRSQAVGLVERGGIDCFLSGPLRTFDLAGKGVKPLMTSIVVLNHRCPFYVVGRGEGGTGHLAALSGKRIIARRSAPPVRHLLSHLARQSGVEGVAWAEAPDGRTEVEALMEGVGDYALLGEPEVEEVVSAARGYIALSLPDEFGPIDYATVVVPHGFVDRDRDLARVIVSSVQAAKDWMCRADAEAVAESLQDAMPETSKRVLVGAIRRGQRDRIWSGGPAMGRWHYEGLMATYTGEDPKLKAVPFSEGVDNRVAREMAGASDGLP